MIAKLLKEIGLNEKEAQIYLSLVKLGTSSAAEIAHEVKLPRQTVYSILQPMVEQSLVEQSDKRGVKQFFTDPNHLLVLLDNQGKEIDKSRRQLEKEIPKLIEKQKRAKELPKVQYYEGRDGLKRLFENILEQHRRGKDKVFRGYGINKFRETLGKFLYDFVRKRARYGVTTNLFIGQGPDDFEITEKTRYGRNVKRLKIDPQQAGIYLAGDRVYLFSYDDNVGVMVENKAIVKLLKGVFDDHWSFYPEPKSKQTK
jgi:HTH-type transcriptional regulator, sugar sensing transcriptional regulator